MAPNPKLKNAAIHIKKSHQGLLHQQLGVKEGDKIPAADLEKAANSQNAATRKRAQFALNARKWGN